MRKVIRTVALAATIGLVATACQKEPSFTQETITQAPQLVMYYSVDGAVYDESLNDEKDIYAFWQHIFALVREGHEVDVFAGSTTNNVSSAKDVVTYTTKSEEDALKWAEKMTDNDYHVHISFKDGVYTCTAVK